MPPDLSDVDPAPPDTGVAVRPRRGRTGRAWRRWATGLILTPLAGLAGLNAWVLAGARGRLHPPASAAMPSMPVALVLGTSPRRPDGTPNRHFQRRLDAAAALHAAGKVTTLLVSGARDGAYYDEPREMRAGLVARGVPEAAIVTDENGMRTFDSVVLAKEAFHIEKCAIISDAWHVPRALFIADRIGLEAVGVRAEPVPLRDSLKARSREWLARVLVVLDLYVLGTRPEHPPSGLEEDLSGRPRS
jgi:SanA protein